MKILFLLLGLVGCSHTQIKVYEVNYPDMKFVVVNIDGIEHKYRVYNKE